MSQSEVLEIIKKDKRKKYWTTKEICEKSNNMNISNVRNCVYKLFKNGWVSRIFKVDVQKGTHWYVYFIK